VKNSHYFPIVFTHPVHAHIYPRGYTLIMRQLATPVFLFDSDCGVCQDGTETIRLRINPPVDFISYQSVDLATYGVSESEVLEGPVLVRTDGTHVVGPLAMAETLRSSEGPYRIIGLIMLLPGIRQLFGVLGPHMYQQRYRLPGGNDSCRVPTQ
jgi:predicted DCC family thiol-disulfide oxidoreductase YuxK